MSERYPFVTLKVKKKRGENCRLCYHFLSYSCFCTELKIKSIKKPTFDFACSVFVHNLGQFSTQDLQRKLIFTLEGVKNRYSSTESKVSAFKHVFPIVCFQHSPGPSQPSPALPSASSASHNAAAPYGSTNTEVLENSRLFQNPFSVHFNHANIGILALSFTV